MVGFSGSPVLGFAGSPFRGFSVSRVLGFSEPLDLAGFGSFGGFDGSGLVRQAAQVSTSGLSRSSAGSGSTGNLGGAQIGNPVSAFAGRVTSPRRKTSDRAIAELHLEHLSGRWDRKAALLDADLTEAAGVVDVMTLTEVRDGLRPDVLPRRGWSVLQDREHGDLAECAILVRDAVWDVVHWHAEVLGPDLGPGGRVVGVFAVLEHKRTGLRLAVGTAHLPASVEGAWGARGRRVLTHQQAVQKARVRIRRMFRRYGCDAAVFTADWNLNLRRVWVRRWIRAAWPGLRLPARIPAVGTHGPRLIDWVIGRRIAGLAMKVLPASDASDHRRVRITGTITRRPR